MAELIHQARRLADLFRGSGIHPTPDSVIQALGVGRELLACGEWSAASDLAETCASKSTGELLLESLLLKAESLLGAGKYDACRDLLIEIIHKLDEAHHPRVLRLKESADVLLGRALWRLHQLGEAEAILNAAYSALVRKPDSSLLGWCSSTLGNICWTRGERDAARRWYLEAAVSARRASDLHLEATVNRNLGMLARLQCRWPEAREYLDLSRDQWLRIGNSSEASHVTRGIALIEWKQGRLTSAEELSKSSAHIGKSTATREAIAYGLTLLGCVQIHKGRTDAAERSLKEAVGVWPGYPLVRPAITSHEYLGDLYLETGRVEEARRTYDLIFERLEVLLPKSDIVAELGRRRAECSYLSERYADGYNEAKQGLQQCRELGDRYEEAATYRVLALSAAALSKAAEAKQWFDQGFAYYEDIETPYEWGKLWMAYGDWLRGSHAGEYADTRGALEAYHAARDHFAGMGAEAKLVEVNACIAEMTNAHERIAAQVAETAVISPLVQGIRRPQRRPRGMAELDRRAAWARDTFGFVTRSRMVLDLLEMTAKLAPSGSPILILGESGTGKELIAHGIHGLSGRTGIFMPINCAAVPRDVIESELFGHVAGAFTGATRDKPGLFESCDHGTVFLDEIAEMSLDLQSRLLRFLEKGEFRRVGSNKLVAVDTLIVAATNRDRGLLEKGENFRPDLYYRLAHAVIAIPPLRRRPEDVDLLVGHFLEEACVRYRKQVSLSDEARNRLVTHSWPGNARQLRSTLTRLVVLADPHQPIPPEAIHLDEAQATGSLTEELEQTERQRIAEALAQARGVRTEAARTLGMSRTTLIGKMKRYGIH